MVLPPQDQSGATPEQVCMLGLYAVGASLWSSLTQSSGLEPPLGCYTPATDAKKVGSGGDASRAPRDRHGVPFHQPDLKSQDSEMFADSISPDTRGQGLRASRSMDLLSRSLPLPPPRQPLMDQFHHHAGKLGIAGDRLEAELPPSPRSSQALLPTLQDTGREPRTHGWLQYLQPSNARKNVTTGAHTRDAKQRSWASFSIQSRWEKRSPSSPDESASSPYVPARMGQIPFSPRNDSNMRNSSRSMSLELPRPGRKSHGTPRKEETVPARYKDEPPQLDRLVFSPEPSQRRWGHPDLHSYFPDSEVSLRDLPRESISSSELEYELERRHSISGSSGHEGFHARQRGDSGGSFASTAPSTVPDPLVTSAFSISDVPMDCAEESGDDEDDIEWERPLPRHECHSPETHSELSRSPVSGPSYRKNSLNVNSEHSRVPDVVSYTSTPRATPKVSVAASFLKRPRRVASSSSLGNKSVDSGMSSFGERARRSLSQARTVLLAPSLSQGRRSTAPEIDSARPTAVYLQPIKTGIISRPCQTAPSPRRNSSIAFTNNTEGRGYLSIRLPSSYLSTSSESESVTGGSSGGSSDRSWESTAPELAALEELVLTECKYLADLQLLMDVYVEGLRRMGLMTPASLDMIVSNLGEVMAFSRFLIDCIRSFLPRRLSPPTSISSQPSNANHPAQVLEELSSEPDYLGLSTKLVQELPARMQVYARYCVGHQSAKERLDFERQLRPAVATFIELARSTNPTLQGMDMAQFLVLPVQRITRYPLLFGCLAKECGKRRNDSDELREEDEDFELSHSSAARETKSMEQRHERAKATYDNWIRLRDVSTSICGITNLAISYQQQEARPESPRARSRRSFSSPLMLSSAQNGPPPPAVVRSDETSKPIKAAGIQNNNDLRTRNTSFSLSSWRKTGAGSDKAQHRKCSSAEAQHASSAPTPSSASSSSSSGSKDSIFGRFLKSFRHPA